MNIADFDRPLTSLREASNYLSSKVTSLDALTPDAARDVRWGIEQGRQALAQLETELRRTESAPARAAHLARVAALPPLEAALEPLRSMLMWTGYATAKAVKRAEGGATYARSFRLDEYRAVALTWRFPYRCEVVMRLDAAMPAARVAFDHEPGVPSFLLDGADARRLCELLSQLACRPREPDPALSRGVLIKLEDGPARVEGDELTPLPEGWHVDA